MSDPLFHQLLVEDNNMFLLQYCEVEMCRSLWTYFSHCLDRKWILVGVLPIKEFCFNSKEMIDFLQRIDKAPIFKGPEFDPRHLIVCRALLGMTWWPQHYWNDQIIFVMLTAELSELHSKVWGHENPEHALEIHPTPPHIGKVPDMHVCP